MQFVRLVHVLRPLVQYGHRAPWFMKPWYLHSHTINRWSTCALQRPTSLSTCRTFNTAISNDTTPSDTIYALSTAPGRAAIAVIRISGTACLDIYRGLCPGKPIPKPRSAVLRRLLKPKQSVSEPVVLDSGALLLYFAAPRTVTGEDVLELHVHGGNAIVKAVLEAIPQCETPPGVSLRYADPGEFTRRAFYNERLDLTQVEALGDVLSAETEQQRRLAVNGSDNSLGARYDEWRKMLLYARGELEALIDFSEDQHFDESPVELMSSVTLQVLQLKRQVDLHIANASKGELLRSGINLALLGAPNAGKSSLLNRIAGRDAAIVSSEAGTTRDIVDIGVDIGGWLCRLGDTAGLRSQLSAASESSIGEIEKEGIRRAKARALGSDVVIAVLSLEGQSDGTDPGLFVDPELAAAIDQCKSAGKAIIVAINKTDKLSTTSLRGRDALVAALSSSSSGSSSFSPLLDGIPASQIVPISCHDAALASQSGVMGSGIPVSDPGNIQGLLRALDAVFSTLTAPSVDGNTTHDPSYWEHSLNVSHRQASNLRQCLTHLNDYLSQSQDGNDESGEVDIVAAAEHLRFAAHCLAKITGRDESGDVESVLGVVFEKFCVGK